MVSGVRLERIYVSNLMSCKLKYGFDLMGTILKEKNDAEMINDIDFHHFLYSTFCQC